MSIATITLFMSISTVASIITLRPLWCNLVIFKIEKLTQSDELFSKYRLSVVRITNAALPLVIHFIGTFHILPQALQSVSFSGQSLTFLFNSKPQLEQITSLFICKRLLFAAHSL